MAALTARGFGETYPGTRRGETADHSVDLQRHDHELGGHGVDLHKYFPGIDLDPAVAFDVLWRRRVGGTQASVDVWYPDVDARALITALHAAREPKAAKVAEDMRRVLTALDQSQLDDLAALAFDLGARVALRAGLETHAESASYVERLGLGDVEVSTYWGLRSQGAGRTSLRLEALRETPWSRRPGQVARWLFPSPALMRVRDPRASRGLVALGVAYLRRLGDGARLAPGAVRDLRRARQGRGGGAHS